MNGNDGYNRAVYLGARAWWRDFATALRFLTRLPLPGSPLTQAADEAPESDAPESDAPESDALESDAPGRLNRAVRAFALVGALVGLAGGLAYGLASGLGLPDIVAAIIALGVMALVTGALHEDGLADVADGFGGGATVEKKLSIMRDSRIGAYGVIALLLVLGAKIGAITDIGSVGAAIAALICGAATSRAAMPAVMRWSTPARSDGLAAAAGTPDARFVWTGLGIALILCVLFLSWAGIVAMIFGAAGAAAVAWLARRQVGGHTGDVLGAVQQISELLFLLSLAAVR